MQPQPLPPAAIRVTSISSVKVNSSLPLPAFLTHVPAGFPSPADDFIEKQLDLNELMIQHPAATFFVRVEGESMINAGIQSGDILVVDRALEPSSGKIIVALLEGEFTVKRMIKQSNGAWILKAENKDYPSIKISPTTDFQVWGVVTYVIHRAQ